MKLIPKFVSLICAMTFMLATFSPASYAQDHNLININTATGFEIAAAIDGVGEVRAAAIVALREQLGGFDDLDQLLEINGIGEATLMRISPQIVLE
jgi:competence protein ComEA